MSIPNKITAIDDALAGMVLAEPVLDGGAVLLPAGATLSDATLSSLRRRGIDTLTIVSPGQAADDASLVMSPEQVALRIESLFRVSGGAGATNLLRELIKTHKEHV